MALFIVDFEKVEEIEGSLFFIYMNQKLNHSKFWNINLI